MHKRRLLMDTKKIKAAIKDGLGKLYKAGFFSIIISQIIVKVVGFCNSIFLVWLLSKSDYGIYSYAQNYLSVILLLDGIGTISSIVQFGSENYNNPLKQVAFSRFGFSIGISFNSILGIGILIYSLVGYFSIEGSGYVLAVMSLQPVLSYVVNYYSVNLRYRLKNKCFSICNVVNSVLNVAALVIGAVIGGVYGVAAALYFSYLISIIIYIIIFAKMKINPFGESEKLGNADKKSFVKLSISAAINESILHLIMVADLFIIGIMIANELVVASYKVATVIPTALVFIPSSIMLFAYPYMARNKDNYKWNLNIIQYNDIYIQITKNSEYEKNAYIESVSLENFHFTDPKIGNTRVYMPNSTEGSLFSYEDNYLINRSLTFNGAKQENSKTLEISSQGGNVIFRVANTEVGEYVSNDDAEIAHNGSLITKTDATLEDLKIQISFDVVIKTNISTYRGNVKLDLPCGDIFAEGTSQLDKKDCSDIIFKRENY